MTTSHHPKGAIRRKKPNCRRRVLSAGTDPRRIEGGNVVPSPTSHQSLGRRIARWLGVTGAITLASVVALATAASASPPTAASGQVWVRFAHLAYGTQGVRVEINGTVVSKAAKFESVTPYQVEPAGTVTVAIKTSGKDATTAVKRVKLSAGSAATVAALAMSGHLRLRVFADNLAAAPTGDAKVRVLDADSKTTALSARFAAVEATTTKASTTALRLAGVVPRIPYGTASAYLVVPAGHYNVSVGNGDGRKVLEGKDWPVSAGTVATLVVVRTSSAPTLVVFDDAAASASAPSGGMQTGFGGTSLPSSHGDLSLDGMVVAGLITCVAFTRRRLVAGARH
jgi:Domain of unknown function (DUF4397)